MSVWKRRAKRDSAEAPIVKALRKFGWRVDYLSAKDLPDLLITGRGVTALAEVKTGTAKLRPGQDTLIGAWQGGPLWLLRTEADAEHFNRYYAQPPMAKG